jgi:hypothetical protein
MSHAKPHDERAGHRTTPAVLDGQAQLVAPPIPRPLAGRLPNDLVLLWDAFWTSPVAVILDPVTDLQPVARLFRLYALQHKMFGALEQHIEWLEEFKDGEFDPGWARNALSFASEIRQLEQTLGITPRGRLVIGAAVAAAGRGQQAPQEHDDADD